MGPCADAAMCTVRSRTGSVVLGGRTPWTTIACGPDCALGRVGEIRGHDDGRRPVDEFAGMVGFDAAETALLLLRPAGTFDFASATTLTLCALARMADKGHTATSIRCRGGSTSFGGGMRWPWKGEAEEEAELGSICCPPRARWKCGAGTTIKDDVVRIQRANWVEGAPGVGTRDTHFIRAHKVNSCGSRQAPSCEVGGAGGRGDFLNFVQGSQPAALISLYLRVVAGPRLSSAGLLR